MSGLIIFILGSAVGSFLNVVLYRLHEGKFFWKGRSFCPKCGKQIAWYDNIPILSFLMLRGKCRHCRKSISWQYPLIELTTAGVFLWLFLIFGLTLDFFVFTVLSCFLIVIFVYDLLHYLILDEVVIPAAIFALFANLYTGHGFWNLILAVFLGGGFFLAQFLISKGRWIGGGDVRLGALMGLTLGFPMVLIALFVAYFAGAFTGLILIIFNHKKMSSKVPFGTFLTAATFITFLYGQQLLSWYLNLINY